MEIRCNTDMDCCIILVLSALTIKVIEAKRNQSFVFYKPVIRIHVNVYPKSYLKLYPGRTSSYDQWTFKDEPVSRNLIERIINENKHTKSKQKK